MLFLEFTVKVLTYFEDYFNIPYPLPKQDMIAIPDFSAGAMEYTISFFLSFSLSLSRLLSKIKINH
jgi:hypothetical protein